MTKKRLLLIASVLFILFIFFSYLVHKNLFTQFDFNMTVRLQDHISHRFDNLFSFFSILGQVTFSAVVLLLIVSAYRKWRGLWLFVLFGVIHLFELYGKAFVNHRPPPQFMLRTMNYATNFPQFYVSEQNSYPSGHAGRAMFLTVVFGCIIWKSKKINREIKIGLLCLLLVYDITMLVSRVYLGEHWTSDVIGGTILGTAMGLLGYVLIAP